jgi:flagellar basal-body rod protein FlgC
MPLFGAIGTAGTGLTTHRKWLDALSDNIANINTVEPTSGDAFRARYIVAQSIEDGFGNGGGVQVTGVSLGSAAGQVVHEPDNPLADADGNVRRPDIDLGDQMTQMIMAQRGYQANLAVIDRAREAYESALQLGRNA